MSTTYEFKQYEILIQGQNSLLGETFPRVFFFSCFYGHMEYSRQKIGKMHADDLYRLEEACL